MAETTQASDKSLGLSITFGVIALLGTLGMLATSYLYALNGDHQMQLYSGVAFAVAVVGGGLAIAVLHMFDN
ncbi:DUF7525 family protein [Salinibaculum rarum]|jgi:hypothetical protein|uniref:DUF7525 family protein n=1 Tax=Salinibaculum rarum TaxID=3058903 RepID=UPI00265F2C9F|nr:hypothetical protein [Salinibaculum sp. KK48]